MKAAIISLTENGRIIAEKIASGLGKKHICTRYAFEKHCDENAISFSDMNLLTAELFHSQDALIFICACGIAVRMIAPHIVSKTTDPAVISIDERGKFAVPLLSGHIGGANALAERTAEIIGAVPVITTATDIGGLFSPDSFAKANHLHICEMNIAKEIASLIINGEKIGFFSRYPYKNLPERFFGETKNIGICISDDTSESSFEITLHLVPKNISVGVGCRKNTPPDAFEEFIFKMLDKNNIPIWRVGTVNTVLIKKDEAAILQLCRKNDLPLRFYSPQELMSVDGEFSHSDFVMKTTGADNICERSAAANGGRIIVPKYAENGMTFAAAEEEICIDFERKIL